MPIRPNSLTDVGVRASLPEGIATIRKDPSRNGPAAE